MTERATIFEQVQLGVEAIGSEGTVVAATKKLSALSIEPTVKANIAKFRPQGTKYPAVTAIGKEWTEAALSGQPTYTEMVYPLASVLTDPVITTPGGATNARLWTFTPKLAAADTPRTFTVEAGSPFRAERFSYGIVKELVMSFNRDELGLSGSMFGRKIADGIQMSTNATYTLTANATPPTAGTYTLTYSGQTTAGIAFGATPATVQTALEALSNIAVGDVVVSLTTAGPTTATANTVYTIEFRGNLGTQPITLTGTFTGLTPSGSIALAAGTVGVAPAAIALVPILPDDLSIYVDTTSGALGGTKLTRWLSGELRIRDRYKPLWVLDSAQSSFVAHVESEPTVELMMTLEADAAGMAFLDYMRNATRAFIRVQGVGGLIESGQSYTFTADLAGEIAAEPPFSDEDGVYAVGFTFTMMADATWGKAYEISLKNALTAL